MYEALLYVHILAAMVWLGGGIAVTILAGRVDRSADAEFRLRFARASAILGPVSAVSASVVLLAGIGLVLLHDHWSISQLWIQLALVLIVLSMGIGGAYFGRAGKRIEQALESRDMSAADRLSRQMSLVSLADLGILLVILGLMVFKPGA